MDEPTVKQPTWIYKADGSSKIVDLAAGEAAPKGWSFDAKVITDESLRTAEAVSGIRPAPQPVLTADGAEAADLEAAQARILELEGIIDAGTAENKRLQNEIDAAEDELDSAAAQISALTAEIAGLKAAAAGS